MSRTPWQVLASLLPVPRDNNAQPGRPTRTAPAASLLLGQGANHLAVIDAAAATYPLAVTRDMAMAIPAVAQGTQTIGLLATLPLAAWTNKDHNRQTPPAVVIQPDPDTPAVTTYQDTFTDMALFGRAYWRVLEWEPAQDNTKRRPRYARYTPAEEIQTDPENSARVVIDGITHDVLTPRNGRAGAPAVIVFDGPLAGGLLGRPLAVRTAYLLESLAAHYADPQIPPGYLQESPNGVPLPSDQVDELLDRWESSRAQRVTGYLGGGLTYHTTRLDPAALQLVEAREMSDARMAQILNLPPTAVNARTAGDSLTYANVTSRRRDLTEVQLAGYKAGLCDRLSLADLTPAGLTINYDLGAFQRADLAGLVELGNTAITAGLMTVSEWRDLAGLTPQLPTETPEVPAP